VSTFEVLYEDAQLLVIDKPAGQLVIPGRAGGEQSIRELLEAERRAKVFVTHRLDRETSGVLVFAKTAEAHRLLSLAFEHGTVRKKYVALVRGRVAQDIVIDVALTAARKGKMRPVRAGESGKPSTTRVRVLETFDAMSLIEAEPLTGRTHQIRVHLLSVGHALVVDGQYGQPDELRSKSGEVVLKRTPLHAREIELPKPFGLKIEAPFPPDLTRALELARLGDY
jgi:RluA family pseudouridine synthase